jgi:2-oxoglutarate ferredoxin oxidoreductase subunit beta
MKTLATSIPVTWCPGCPNAQILFAFRGAVQALEKKGVPTHTIVAGAGIGCHGKISDYLAMNTFNGLHGRVIPALTGIKLANPNLTVVGFVGDGDALSEGFSHLCHAAKRNSDITVILHNNQVFALTTGQSTGTSPRGHKGGTTPFGSPEDPLDPSLLMLVSGATFVARTYAGDLAMTQDIFARAMQHKGFSFVEVLQPCITFYDTRAFIKEHAHRLEQTNTNSFADAYNALQDTEGGKIPLGIFYEKEKESFEETIRS